MSTPRKIRCTVERITDHGDRVYTVDLNPERPVPTFRPGQFLHLTLDDYDPSGFWPESRVFSIASSTGARDKVRIIYSVKGGYTTRMERELSAGRGVWVKLPYGDFVVDGDRDAVLIAGGTGITAFQAFIEGQGENHSAKVVLLYGARRSELLLGREMIEAKRRAGGNFLAFLFAEDCGPQPSLHPDDGRTAVLPGRIRLDVLKDCGVGVAALYYLAGPPPMVTALRAELGRCGVTEGCVRVDAWE
jgi:NAD(P)H-flavin reductase